jgi:hypothetical protein
LTWRAHHHGRPRQITVVFQSRFYGGIAARDTIPVAWAIAHPLARVGAAGVFLHSGRPLPLEFFLG